MNFFPDFAPNSRKEWRLLLFQSNLRKQIRNLPKILNFVKIIHYYSKLFTSPLSGQLPRESGQIDTGVTPRESARACKKVSKQGRPAFFENAFFENAFFENAFSKMHFSKILQIFGGLVLGCIKTKFCKKICVWQHSSSSRLICKTLDSTRFAYFCTAAISKF